MIVSHTSHFGSSSNINEYNMKWIVLKNNFHKIVLITVVTIVCLCHKVTFIYEIVEKTPLHHFKGNMTTAERN
jgi:hypothetical protein